MNTGETRLSVARIGHPGLGRARPAPDFDEWTLVLDGTLRVEHETGVIEVRADQAILVARRRVGAVLDPLPRRSRVRRGLPAAFAPDTVHRDDDGA